MAISYTKSLDGIDATMLTGFFEGWPRQPGPDEHLRMLKGSSHVVLAIDETPQRIVGRIAAISDGCHSAFVCMFEVLPNYRRQGIGRRMAELLFEDLRNFSNIDLTCAPELRPYYGTFGMQPTSGMAFRNHDRSTK
jgi:ribosomal protein S18 acetylase RimI-like enzyme